MSTTPTRVTDGSGRIESEQADRTPPPRRRHRGDRHDRVGPGGLARDRRPHRRAARPWGAARRTPTCAGTRRPARSTRRASRASTRSCISRAAASTAASTASAATRSSRAASTAPAYSSQALAGLDRPPRALVSASAVGYYGSCGDEILTEASPAGTGFLAELCQAWESATAPAADAGIRVVNPRFGVVLTTGATPLSRLLLPFRLGLGATIGSGRQFMSWVHLDDAVAALTRLVADERLEGPVNVTSPFPVTNREFTKTLGRALGRPAWLRAPAWAISSRPRRDGPGDGAGEPAGDPGEADRGRLRVRLPRPRSGPRARARGLVAP